MNKISELFPAVLISLAFSLTYYSCTATPERFYTEKPGYEADYPMTADPAYSLSTPLVLKIPKGWFTAEDNDCNCIDIWLIRDDFSATMSLTLFNVTSSDSSQIVKATLEDALKFSKKFKEAELKDKFSILGNDEFFFLNNKRFAAYSYLGDENLPIRIVVFDYSDKYFEFSAVPAKSIGKGEVNPQELFRVQQSVLASATW